MSGATHCRDCLFSIELPLFLCQRSAGCVSTLGLSILLHQPVCVPFSKHAVLIAAMSEVSFVLLSVMCFKDFFLAL